MTHSTNQEIKNKLEFLSRAKDYVVSRVENDDDGLIYYVVSCAEADLSVTIVEGREPAYWVDGIYNSGLDSVELDINALDGLRSFVNLLLGGLSNE